MSSIPDKASYSINMSPPVGNMEHEHTTDEFYFGATGLNLGKNYMFGIFATMEDGKRTDVRSMTYKTREYSIQTSYWDNPDLMRHSYKSDLMGVIR